MDKAQNLEQIVNFDGLTRQIREFPDSPTFRLLKTSLHKVVSDFYHAKDGSEAKELVLDEKGARDLADRLFEVAADHIAINYLKLKEERIKELKAEKDPASGKSQWESFIREHLGVDKDAIYEALKTRGVVRPEEIDGLIRPIYDAHANAYTSKAVTARIDTMEKATALLGYLGKLKGAQPKTLEPVAVPTTVKSVEEAQRLYVSAIQLLSRDYKPDVAEAYQKRA